MIRLLVFCGTYMHLLISIYMLNLKIFSLFICFFFSYMAASNKHILDIAMTRFLYVKDLSQMVYDRVGYTSKSITRDVADDS